MFDIIIVNLDAGSYQRMTPYRDNLCLIYGLMPQDIPATCDGCGKKFSIEHALSCPKGGLVLAFHYDTAK